MSIRRKKTFVLPRDCDKLDIDFCEHPKYENKCLVKTSRLGSSKCVANENYQIENLMKEKGFKEFSKIDPENVKEDILKRNEVCSSLSRESCRSPQAKMLGCKYTKGYFSKGRCSLSDEIINYYYKYDKKCLCKGCNEDRQTSFLFKI